ncbi:MAG: hypothetical protein H5U07_09665, partial [Candidatus Aminicenantes bacterium]|nr:hypothetical protein [Candidatus Aminicenantes bacterium]
GEDRPSPARAGPRAAGTRPRCPSQKASVIPKDIKDLLDQGLATRQGKMDLPFQFYDVIVLPAKGTYIAVLVTKIKNADLQYAPSPADQENLKTNVEVFFDIYQMKNSDLKLVAEHRTASSFSIPAADYNPEAEANYYLGYPLKAGKYLLACAIGNPNTKKLGITYYEFEIPDYEKIVAEGKLETSSLFLLKDIQQMDTQENYPNFHKDYFSWIIFRAYPAYNNILKPGDQPTLMFMIYGTKFNENQKVDLEINYDIRKDNTKIVAFTPMKYDSPFIEQPIPIPTSKKVQIKDDKGERIEDRPIEPGNYELVINIKDNLSGLTLEKRIPFELVTQ